MFSDGMDPDWKPPPPAEHGSWRWKYETAVAWMIEHGQLKYTGKTQRIIRLPLVDGIDLGYMAISRDSAGHNYIYGEEIETP